MFIANQCESLYVIIQKPVHHEKRRIMKSVKPLIAY